MFYSTPHRLFHISPCLTSCKSVRPGFALEFQPQSLYLDGCLEARFGVSFPYQHVLRRAYGYGCRKSFDVAEKWSGAVNNFVAKW